MFVLVVSSRISHTSPLFGSLLANSVFSFSALVMLRSRNALSCCSSCRSMCRIYRLRALRADGGAGAATVLSSVSGGSSVADDVAKAW